MKKIAIALMSLLAVTAFTSCELDNYDAPDVMLKGTLVYNGTPINVKNNQVTIRLYEDGWELTESTYFNVPVAQDGTFSANIFKGKNYRLVRQNNAGPWVDPTASDVITLTNYNGEAVTMAVTPYFMFDKASISSSGKVINATFNVKEITAGKRIQKVGLYVSRNIICDNGNSGLGNKETTAVTVGKDGTLSVDLSNLQVNSTYGSLPKTGFVYARLGFQVAGYTNMIYSEPVKLQVQ